MSHDTFAPAFSSRAASAAGGDDTPVWEIPLSQIVPNPHQPRRHFDEDALLELAESILQHGVLQPILLRQIAPEQYEIIAGERRFRAAGLAGLTTIPAIVKTLTDREQAEISLIENLQREDLNPVETARAFRTLMSDFGLTQQELAERVGKSQGMISHLLRLLKLPDEILDSLDRGDLLERHARALLRIEDDEALLETYREVMAHRLSARETDELIRNRSSVPPQLAPSSAAPLPLPAEPVETDVEERTRGPLSEYDLREVLSERLATRVAVQRFPARGGYIEINFRDEDNLLHLLNRLTPPAA